MNAHRKLVSSAIAFVSAQEGEVGEGELAFHATFIVAVVWVLFIFAAFSFAALFIPEFARFGRRQGKWASLLIPVAIWVLQYPLVKDITRAILDGRCGRVPKSYAVWSLVVSFGAFLVSVVATLAINRT